MKLWLDDVRPAPEGDDEWVTFTRPWPMLLFILKMGDIVTEWSLDHDFGLEVCDQERRRSN